MSAGDYLWQIDISYPAEQRFTKPKRDSAITQVKLYITTAGGGKPDRQTAEKKASGFCDQRAFPGYRIDRSRCLGTIDA